MLLLSWIQLAKGGGRGIVTLYLLNHTEVRSFASPTHPQDDVGTIATKGQTSNAQAEGFVALKSWLAVGSVCTSSAPSGISYGVSCSFSS